MGNSKTRPHANMSTDQLNERIATLNDRNANDMVAHTFSREELAAFTDELELRAEGNAIASS